MANNIKLLFFSERMDEKPHQNFLGSFATIRIVETSSFIEIFYLFKKNNTGNLVFRHFSPIKTSAYNFLKFFFFLKNIGKGFFSVIGFEVKTDCNFIFPGNQ